MESESESGDQNLIVTLVYAIENNTAETESSSTLRSFLRFCKA